MNKRLYLAVVVGLVALSLCISFALAGTVVPAHAPVLMPISTPVTPVCGVTAVVTYGIYTPGAIPGNINADWGNC